MTKQEQLEKVLDTAIGNLNSIVPKSVQSISRAYTLFCLNCKDETAKGVMYELLSNIRTQATIEQIEKDIEFNKSSLNIAKS